MTETPKEPGARELFDSMTWLEGRFAQLEERIEAVAKTLERHSAFSSEVIEQDMVQTWINAQDFRWVLERLKQLELAVFPGLVGDLCRVNEITGEGDKKGYNALDHRDFPELLK